MGYYEVRIPTRGLAGSVVQRVARGPPSFLPGLMHGDFHLANIMYRRDGPEVAAIVDWEMCTVGDPPLDLGGLPAPWPGPNQIDVTGALGAAGGLPGVTEIVRRYH